jgi:DNA-binding LacI/PurR family transcriptional regulator
LRFSLLFRLTSVIGISNWQIATTVISPTLTSIVQPEGEMGKIATRLLIQQIVSKKEYHKDFATKI